jgi:hypothetical protein
MPTTGEKKRRASLPETIGAWLRVWTPSRDVEVPPVPVRKLLIGGAALVVLVAAATAIVAPRIDDSKERTAAADARERAELAAARRDRQIAEQRPRHAAARDLLPAAGAPEHRQIGAREALLTRVEQAITADGRQRAATGELERPAGAAECEPYPAGGTPPEHDLGRTTGVYDCLALVRAISATDTNVGGKLGYPFRAVVDFRTFRFSWCKTNPIPGERVVPDPRTVVSLPQECRKPARG